MGLDLGEAVDGIAGGKANAKNSLFAKRASLPKGHQMTSLLWRNPVQQNFGLLLKQRFSVKKSPTSSISSTYLSHLS
jgi:hypothetical protein